GVVDQQVDPPELVEDPPDRAGDLVLVGDVAGDGQGRALGATVRAGVAALADLGRDRLDLFGRAGKQRDRAALVGQRERGRAADAAAGAGHDRDLVTQAHGRDYMAARPAARTRAETCPTCPISAGPNDDQPVGARLGAPDLARAAEQLADGAVRARQG